MANPKFLIDTNIVIGLEDNHVVGEIFSQFLAKCSEHSCPIFVHEASRSDILNDKNADRRKVTLSKLRKFQVISKIKLPPESDLIRMFGEIKNDHDRIDVELLYALKQDVVDFLVTEDRGLLRRAERSGLTRRVFDINEAATWLRNTYDPSSIVLPNIVDGKVYQLNPADPLFHSIQNDYQGFQKWLEKCRKEHRSCWTVSVGSNLAAILIYKNEIRAESDIQKPGEKVLKICTLKVGDRYTGDKLGEQLLKQCLWFAQKNRFDIVYLTVFPKQEALILLIKRFGFEETKHLPNGELVFEKSMAVGSAPIGADQPLEFHRKYYPKFLDVEAVRKFCVPIWPKWHERLFPELRGVKARSLAAGANPTPESQRPGNTIRKVYLCRAKTGSIRPGDILLFYMTKGEGQQLSQSITTIGVVERVRETSNLAELLRMTGKRSVFSEAELKEMIGAKETPVQVIDFLLSGHFKKAISLEDSMKMGMLRSWPQTIGRVDARGYRKMRQTVRLGWET